MKSFQREEEFVIEDLDALKVIVDPLRNQILEVLIIGPLTVKQIAERLGLAPSKLYYHVNMMENFNFITVVETRMVANMVEKYYQATAKNFRVAPELLTFHTDDGRENVNTLLRAVLDSTREDILRSLQARAFELERGKPEHERTIVLTRLTSRLPSEKADELRSRILELLQEFEEADEPDTAVASEPYAFTIAFYPSVYFSEDETS